MSKHKNREARFNGTDPFERIADLDRIEELEKDVKVSDPSDIPAVPVSSAYGRSHADIEVTEAGNAASNHGAFGEPAGLIGILRGNPMPLALFLLSVGLLVRDARRPPEARGSARAKAKEIAGSAASKAGEVVHGVGDKASDVAHRVGEVAGTAVHRVGDTASSLTHQASDKAHDAATGLSRVVQERPLVVGALFALLGAIIGLLLPETRKENELFGATRDRLVDSAKETAQELAETAKTVAKDAAQEVGDTVKQVAKESADTLKQEAASHGLAPQQS